MSEPRRLREASTNSFERAILDAGVGYRSSEEAKARTLAALGLAGSALVSAGVAASASSSLFGKLSLGKLLAVLSAVGAVAAVPVAYWALGQPSEPLGPPLKAALARPSSLEPREPRNTPVAGVSDAEPSALPVVSAENTAVGADASARADTSMRASGADKVSARALKNDGKPAASGALLTAELEALDAARAALSKGEPRRALSLLDGYQKTYPRGRLMLEAEVLRIDALSRSGDTQAAKQRAAAFVRRHPSSVLSARVRGYLDG